MISRQGTAFLTQEKAGELAASAPDYATEDLFNAIDEGDFPIWDCSVQTMTAKQAEEYKINVFDLTKVWSHKDFPLRKFGELTLNRNVLNVSIPIDVCWTSAHVLLSISPKSSKLPSTLLTSFPE